MEAYKEFEKEEGAEGKRALPEVVMAEVQKLMAGGGGKDMNAVVKSALAMAAKMFMSKSGGSGGGGAGGLGALMSNPQVAGLMNNPQVADMLKKFM